MRIVRNIADFGSCIVFRLKGISTEVVDLKSLYFDHSIQKIQDAPFIIWEKEFLNIEIADKNWKNKKILLNSDKEKITIYLYFGYFEKRGRFKKGLKIYSEEMPGYKDGVLLYEADLDEYPFYDFHLNKVNGRFLGVGTYEELFDSQIRALTIAGLKARALELSTKQIFAVSDKTAYKNLSTDLETGDVIVGDLRQSAG